MNPTVAAKSVINFYVQGFRSMTVGRKLWALIIIKLIIIFAVLKLFFFPNFLNTQCKTDEERAEMVRREMLRPDREY